MAFWIFVFSALIAFIPLGGALLQLLTYSNQPDVFSKAGFSIYYPEVLFVNVAMIGGSLLDVLGKLFKGQNVDFLQSNPNRFNMSSQVFLLVAAAWCYAKYHPSGFSILDPNVNFFVTCGIIVFFTISSVFSCFCYYRAST
jgi:hypothetical protein